MKSFWVLLFCGPVWAQVIAFSDLNLEQALVNGFWSTSYPSAGSIPIDGNSDGVIDLTEAQQVTGYVDLSQNQIADLSGLEHFSNMRYLNLGFNEIISVSFEGWTNLMVLDLRHNQIVDVLLSDLPSMETVDLDTNAIDFANWTFDGMASLKTLKLSRTGMETFPIDLQDFPSIEYLMIESNSLTEMVLTGHERLYLLDVSSNPLSTNLHLHNLPSLAELSVTDCGIQELDLAEFTAIKYLNASFNELTAFDAASLPALNYLNLSTNPLNDLDVSSNLQLQTLLLRETQIVSLDLNNLNSLERIELGGGSFLQDLQISDLPGLTHFTLTDAAITELFLINLPSLRQIRIRDAGITDLVLASLPNTISVLASGNSLKSLVFSDLPLLFDLNLPDNQIASFELEGLPALSKLNLSNNELSNLTLNDLPELDKLVINDNQFQHFDVSDFPGVSQFEARGNQLQTIELSNCTLVDIADNCLSQVVLPTSVQVANVSENSLTDLQLPNSLWSLKIHSNPLTALDFSPGSSLLYLSMGDMILDSVSLINLSELVHLELWGPEIPSAIDYGLNPHIRSLFYSNVRQPVITVPELPMLEQLAIEGSVFESVSLGIQSLLHSITIHQCPMTEIDWMGSPWLSQTGVQYLDLSENLLSEDDCGMLQTLAAQVHYLGYNPQGGLAATPSWDSWPSNDLLSFLTGHYVDHYLIQCD